VDGRGSASNTNKNARVGISNSTEELSVVKQQIPNIRIKSSSETRVFCLALEYLMVCSVPDLITPAGFSNGNRLASARLESQRRADDPSG
jgi:hypothetical protein